MSVRIVFGLLSFVWESFVCLNVWRQFKEDAVRFGKHSHLIAYVRSFILLNGLVLPVIWIWKEPVRAVGLFLDLFLLPLLAFFNSYVGKYMEKEARPYTQDRVQWGVLGSGVVFAIINQIASVLHSEFTHKWVESASATVHNLLYPMFFLRFGTLFVAPFDTGIHLPWKLRLAAVTTSVVSAATLLYSLVEFFFLRK